MGGAGNDLHAQVSSLRDLGALPADADIDHVIRELKLDQAPVDPTQLSGDQLVGELQEVIKALLGIGAKFPKELMLFVKNMVFLDGAITRLAPDLDLFAEIAGISVHFATHHGDRIMADVGIDPRSIELDMTAVANSFGIEDADAGLTHRDLRARRETIRRNLAEREGRG
jgi:ubiquinone biosynthesis protein